MIRIDGLKKTLSADFTLDIPSLTVAPGERVALIDHGKLDTIDTPDVLISALGPFTVEETSDETLLCHYFQTREEAIAYLPQAGPEASLRNTTLEDVFVERIGRRINQK